MSVIADIHNDMERGARRLITEYRARLFSDAVRLCENMTDAEDLVSQTFAKVVNSLDSYKEDDNFYGWMKTIMINIRRNDLARPVARGTVPVDAATLARYAGADTSTDEQILVHSDHDALREAIGELDPEYRQLLAMYYFNELTLKEIASFLRSSTSSVSRKLELSRRILAAKLQSRLGKKPLAVILVALFSLVSAAAVATLPAFEPLRATAAGWFGASVETPAETPPSRVVAAAEPADQEETKTNEQFEVVKEESQEMNKITNVIAAAVSATVLSTNAAAAESPALQPAKTAAVQGAAPVKLAAAASVLKLNATPGGTRAWTGATSGDWHTPTNWDPEGVPTAADDIVLAAPESGSYTVTASQAIEVHSLTVGSDTAGTNCLATFESKTNGTHRIGGDLVVKAGGKLTHTALPTSASTPAAERYKLNLEVGGDVTVMSNGTIDVTSRGYGDGKGPGFVPTDGDIMNYGAHGGTHKAGYTYGSLCSPTNCGSGCGNAGGGAVFIKALSGTITVDGSVVSSSTDVNGGYGAGAGGSVWLISQRLSGSGAGTISANGGYQYNGSSGCGGRISICLADAAGFSGWHGTISARGGDSHAGYKAGRGAPGTIYLQSAGDGAKSAVTIIDNGNLSVNRDSFVELNAANESAVIGSIVVTNKGGLVVSPGESITVYGSIDTRDARTASWSDGTVCMRGSACSTISGGNKFGDFVCTEPGKTILFGTAANDNFEIATGHKLTLKGDEETTLDLRPADETLPWKMKVNSDVETEIYYVSVSNSNAKAGEFVTAYGSKDLGGNVSWIFTDIIEPGETITWTGATDSDWMNPGNWDRKRKVVETDVAVIPSVIDEVPVTTMPVLDKGKVLINEVRVESGATMTLKGYDLTVTNKLTVAGTLTALGKEKIFCSKDVDFTGGTFVAGGSSLVFSGADAQQVNLNGQDFSTITIEKETGAVTFADGFKAEYLDAHSAEALTIVFAAGKTVDVARLILRGERADGGRALVLRSSADGTPWKLKSGTAQFITGVDVKDSDASAGEWARTDFTSTDSHNNTHWDFGAGGVTNAQWIGTSSSGDFSVAANWSTGKVPDENTRVLIRAGDGETKTVTANAAISVHDLILQGERSGIAVFESATKETHRIEGDLVINLGGKMTHTALPTDANAPAGECYKLNLDVGGNVTVAEDGSIDVSGCGYASGKGPGYFNDTVQQCVYAAHGGAHYAGQSYGSLCAPTNCGSGSGGVAGGGAVHLVVDGVLRNDGMIVSSADTVTSGYGGGAGGSIWIECTDVLGSGRISADGGYSNAGGSGCGGRVAVWTKDVELRPEVQEKISACGGGSSSYYRIGAGAPGTVYLQTGGKVVTTATTIVDNNNLKVNTTVHQGSFVELNAANASDVIGSIVIRNKAGVKMSPKTSVKLYGNWFALTGGTVGMAADAVLRLMGTNMTTIAGVQTIDRFLCSDKKKPLCVRDGAVLKLAANSRIGDVDLATDDVTLNVGTNVLTVCTYVHKDGKGWADELDKLVVKEVDPVTGKTGDIVWKPQGFLLFVK